MMTTGCGFHSGFQQVAWCNSGERTEHLAIRLVEKSKDPHKQRRLVWGTACDLIPGPPACAQAFGREEWVFVIRFPSDESLGLDMSALPGLTPKIPTPPTKGGMGHPLQD